MLEKLNDINWKKLGHAYGSAKDVPELLRTLASDDAEKRQKAYYALYGNVFHQGTRWEVSSHVIPFLYEILSEPNTQDKADLIEYILHLAVGYPEEWLPFGVDIKEWQRDIDDEYYTYAKDCYYNAAKGEALLLRETFSEEEAVRINAVWALAYFAALLNMETVRRIEEITQIGASAAEKAGAVFTLGIIDFQTQATTHLPLLKALFQSEEMLVKTAAAMSILLSDGFVQNRDEVLFLAALSPDDIEEMSEQSPFYEGNMQGYISLVLSLAGADDIALILPNMTALLPGLTPVASLSVTAGILMLVEKANPDLEVPYGDFKAFEPVSQDALRAIAMHGGWKMGGTFANYSELMRSFGYISDQDKFKSFVGLD